MRLKPLGGQPLGFGYLFAIHPPFGSVFVTLRKLISLGCGEIVPHIGEQIIFRNTFTIGVPIPEVGLGYRVSLLSGQPIPAHRLRIVPWDALATLVHKTEAVLGWRKPLLCC